VERLKASFAEEVKVSFIKIANLQNQVDQMTTKYSSTTKFIEDDYKYKYEKLVKEKDEEVKKLMSKINDLLEYNDNLNIKVDENLTIIEELRKNYSDKIHELHVSINNKDLEMSEMKNFYESKINSLIKSNEEEKSRIVSNYEQNFDK
jgi:type III secretory pathway component EscV